MYRVGTVLLYVMERVCKSISSIVTMDPGSRRASAITMLKESKDQLNRKTPTLKSGGTGVSVSVVSSLQIKFFGA